MDEYTLRQLYGAKTLLYNTVDAAVTVIAETHLALAEQPYALLGRVAGIAEPAQAIGQAQISLASSIYHSIRLVNRFYDIAATQLLDQLAAQVGPPPHAG